VPRKENEDLYKQYKALADATPDVRFLGRLASYKYFNMDQVEGQALATFAKMHLIANFPTKQTAKQMLYPGTSALRRMPTELEVA
jgi:hypothetical protein